MPTCDRYLCLTRAVSPPVETLVDCSLGLCWFEASLAPSGVQGSGTHGLQTLTTSPPPRLRAGNASDTSLLSLEGGCTTYCLGIVMRCGEQLLHTTRPHFLQWCLRKKNEKDVLQTGQALTSWSACHFGTGSRLPLSRIVLVDMAEGWVGRSRLEGDKVGTSCVVFAVGIRSMSAPPGDAGLGSFVLRYRRGVLSSVRLRCLLSKSAGCGQSGRRPKNSLKVTGSSFVLLSLSSLVWLSAGSPGCGRRNSIVTAEVACFREECQSARPKSNSCAGS